MENKYNKFSVSDLRKKKQSFQIQLGDVQNKLLKGLNKHELEKEQSKLLSLISKVDLALKKKLKKGRC